MKKDTAVIYHAHCPDGFGAALAAWLVLGDTADYHPCTHGDAPPDVAGQNLYILDFSFERSVMEQLDATTKSLVMLDHHKTAVERLEGFKCRCGKVHFDLSKSGARLAWEHFHPGTEVPELIRLIEDRDLWRWSHPHTADYLASLDALPFDFNVWEQVLRMPSAKRERFIERGNAMNEKFDALCESIAQYALPVVVNGVSGLMVNAPGDFSSRLGELLAKRSGTFGLVWKHESPTTVKVSLRSVAPFEVEPIARAFGGGGHPQAAAFRLPLERFMELGRGRLDA